MRIGLGEDIHLLVPGRKLVLGGITIPFEKGELAHSDGDVLLHAIADALYGAIASKDIGRHFSDSDEANKNLSSKIILQEAYRLVKEKGYVLSSLDSNIILEQPKLSPYIDSIRENLALLLETDINNISVKAKTFEGLGDIGSGKAIKASCILLLKEAKE